MGLHETLEVHELLTFKNLSVTKSFAMSKLAQDEELKAILSGEVNTGRQFINQLKGFITDGSESS